MTTPSDSRFPFESNEQRVLDRTRRDQQAPTPAGYESSEGETLTIPGDETAPYVHALGRTSTDGVGTGVPNTIDGQPQRVLVDEVGRVWTLPAPGGVQNVMGDIAHDAPDVITSFPVKVGGHANAGARADVGENDRVDASYDLAGRARVAISSSLGDALTGTSAQIDSFAAGAVLLATHDREVGTRSTAASIVDSDMTVIGGIRGLVSRASTATQGLFAVGNVAHDAVDSNNPVKVGGIAVANGAVPAAVAAADRVNAAFSLNGAAHGLVSPNPIADATTYAYTNRALAAGSASAQVAIKASAGRLRRLAVINNDLSLVLYLQIFNTAAVGSIATGTLIWGGLAVPAGGYAEFDFSEADLACSTGICAALSTTQAIYTAAAVTGLFAAQYA